MIMTEFTIEPFNSENSNILVIKNCLVDDESVYVTVSSGSESFTAHILIDDIRLALRKLTTK
jgi:hypothetical protein